MDRKWLWATIVSLFGVVCVVQATPIDYPDKIDPNQVSFTFIQEDSGTDPNIPHFGAPRRIGNRLAFTPTNFSSYSAGNSSEGTQATLTMEITAPAGKELEKIIIREIGDCTLTGSSAHAEITGLLVVTNLEDEFADPLFTGLSVSPPGTANPVEGGGYYARPSIGFVSFVGTLEIDMTGMGWTHVFFSFNNNLFTGAGSESTAYIQKKSITDNITLEVLIPEPASILSLLVFSLMAVGRRKV